MKAEDSFEQLNKLMGRELMTIAQIREDIPHQGLGMEIMYPLVITILAIAQATAKHFQYRLELLHPMFHPFLPLRLLTKE